MNVFHEMLKAIRRYRLIKRLEAEHAKSRAEFLKRIRDEGYTLLDDSQVVCDTCMSNCGQCGSSIRMHTLTKEYDTLNACHQITLESFKRHA